MPNVAQHTPTTHLTPIEYRCTDHAAPGAGRAIQPADSKPFLHKQIVRISSAVATDLDDWVLLSECLLEQASSVELSPCIP